MLTVFPPVRTIQTGELVGARTWLNLIARRANWCYGVAHGQGRFFRQAHQTFAGEAWTGETRYRAAHPTLNFSAEINQGSGTSYLYYYGSDLLWHELDTDDSSGGWSWFGGSQNMTYDCSGLSLPANGVLRLKFNCANEVYVYHAYMSGTTGLSAWPTVPTFVDGAGHEPSAAQLDSLRLVTDYLYERACMPLCGTPCAKLSWTATGSVYRLAFRYGGCKQLRLTTTVEGCTASGHVYGYIEADTFRGTNTGEVLDIDADEAAASHLIDLSALGLTVGNRYILNIVTAGDPGYVTLLDAVIEDPAGATRANVPHYWSRGDHVLAAQLNAIANDCTAMRDDPGSTSPIWPEHHLTSNLPADCLEGVTGPYYRVQRLRFTHRFRFLRWRGGGRLASAVLTNKVQSDRMGGTYVPIPVPLHTKPLSDSDPAGEPQMLDLDSVPWLAYGMDYYVEDYGSSVILGAQEDYDA